MDVNDFLQQLQRKTEYRDQIAHLRKLPARPAIFGRLSTPLPPILQQLLAGEGIENLFSHQAQAVELLRQGKDVLVVTGTASGKTLCYNLPVVERILTEPGARAMYLFPTKALAQDQLATLQRWIASSPDLKSRLRAATYDGDTPSSARNKIRTSANIILTNPDMLHQSILPYHAKWAAFFRNLRYIVIDELHMYRGIFGSQFANVLRRLSRLLEFHGGKCQFICASATIGNPRELAERLIQRPVEVVDNDGSPRGDKYFVFWNPPYTDASHLARRSSNIEAKKLFTDLIRFGSQTIVFTRARVVAELIYRYARQELIDAGGTELADSIRAYRGGYLAEDRREIEKLLFTGQLRGVAATNALELGIDVGSLDAAIMVGFPGSISSAWQQAGRSGRRSSESLAILVAGGGPIDQYLMHHPDYFFNRDVERAIIDPDNPHILAGHLTCAAFELPLVSEDKKYFGPVYARILDHLTHENPDMHTIADHTHWASAEFPASKVNLRTVGQNTFAIVDTTAGGNTTIGTLDRIAALEQLYPAAVYLHDGRSFIVTDLSVADAVAKVEETTVDYYTQPIISSGSRVLHQQETKTYPFGEIGLGELEVNWQTTGYKRIKFYTQETISIEPLSLPPQYLNTQGFWLLPSEEIFAALTDAGYIPLTALAGLRNLFAWSLPLLAMCDPGDISAQINVASFNTPAIVLYDRYLGGLGFAKRGFENFSQLLSLAVRILTDCPCEDGCPSCVGVRQITSALPGNGQMFSAIESPDKPATVFLLEQLLKRIGE
jgi:DEAD/DEAH box helicase domain-containing protein